MNFPEVKIVICGGYSISSLGLERYLSVVDYNDSTIEELFDLQSIPSMCPSYRDWNKKRRTIDIMALTEDNRFMWWRYRNNNKEPALKYSHEFADFERYIFVATFEERNEYFFDTDYDNLIKRLCKIRKNGEYQILRICKDYRLGRKVLDLVNRNSDEYKAIIDTLKEASRVSPENFYDECMKYVAAEVNWIKISDGISKITTSYWNAGDWIYRSYEDFETTDRCKEFIEDPYLIFDSDYKYGGG